MPTEPNYLKEFSCFHKLSDEHLKAIAEITNAICYPQGYILFKEGEPGNRLFFLVKGKIEVMYNVGEAGLAHVDTISGEEIVGCSALVEPYVYTATERSVEEIEVLEVDALALRKLMERDCCLGIAIQQRIVSVLTDRILDLRLGGSPR